MSRFWRKATTKTTRESNPLTLSNAMICLDCEHIYSAYNPRGTCPKCGSDAVQLMSRWVPTFKAMAKPQAIQGVA